MTDWPRLSEHEDVRHRCFALRRALAEYKQAFTENMRARTTAHPDATKMDKNSQASELAEAILNQANQLRKALEHAEMAGMDDDLALRLRHLRNVREHWEQHRDSFGSRSRPKTGSGDWCATRFPDKTPWSAGWSNTEGFTIGGIINLGELQEVLDRVEPAIAQPPWV